MIEPAFLPRTKPTSTIARPPCMNITRQPERTTQAELSPTSIGIFPAKPSSLIVLSPNAAGAKMAIPTSEISIVAAGSRARL